MEQRKSEEQGFRVLPALSSHSSSVQNAENPVLRSSTETLATQASSGIKRKAGVFNLLRFEDFNSVSVDGRPYREG